MKQVRHLRPGSSAALSFLAAVSAPGAFEMNQFVVELALPGGDAAHMHSHRFPGSHVVKVVASTVDES